AAGAQLAGAVKLVAMVAQHLEDGFPDRHLEAFACAGDDDLERAIHGRPVQNGNASAGKEASQLVRSTRFKTMRSRPSTRRRRWLQRPPWIRLSSPGRSSSMMKFERTVSSPPSAASPSGTVTFETRWIVEACGVCTWILGCRR